VSARDVVSITEQSPYVIDDLTEEEAAALHELGRNLRGSRRYWQGSSRVVDGDLDDEDPVDGEEAADDRRTAILVSRRPKSAGWSVTVHNAIGAVSVGDLQLLIRPKIPEAHFAKLMMLAADPGAARLAEGALQLDAAQGALSAVWLAYLDALALTLRADLHHDYVEVTDDPPYVRGRLDARATAVNLARGRLRFPADFEDLSVDNPVNRTLKSACVAVAKEAASVAGRLANDPDAPQYAMHRRIERRAREASYHLSQAGDLQPGDLHSDVPRLAVHQRRALMIARNILSAVGRSVSVGDCEASCFLQPTPLIAESAVRNLLSHALGPDHIVTNRSRKAAGLTFNPDLVVEGVGTTNGGIVATGDVKYRLRKENWPRGTLEQAIAFRQVYGARLGFFIDFATGDSGDADQSVNIGGVKFHRVSWPADELTDPEAAAARVVESCRAFLCVD
jgi:hypothetical protein